MKGNHPWKNRPLPSDHGLAFDAFPTSNRGRCAGSGRAASPGKVTMLAGHPGLGKSQLALAIVSIVTTGGRFPVNGARAECGSAVILSAEDDAEDTIRPRLDAVGADLARWRVVGAVHDRDDTGRDHMRGFSVVDDMPRLATALAEIGDAVLVIVDPITAYLGATDSHRNAEVRSALTPLTHLAAEHRVAVLAISHLRKSLEGEAIPRVSGSLAFVAAARAAYVVTRDPANENRRLANRAGEHGRHTLSRQGRADLRNRAVSPGVTRSQGPARSSAPRRRHPFLTRRGRRQC